MFYYGYHFMGMHLVWWFIWIVSVLWIFSAFIPGRAGKKDSPLHILKKRFAAGEITKEEYLERKKILEDD